MDAGLALEVEPVAGERHSYKMTAETVEYLSNIRGVQRNPIVPSPAEDAANRAQCEHGQQAIERAQLRLLEFLRIAARALMPDPKRVRQPIGPIPA